MNSRLFQVRPIMCLTAGIINYHRQHLNMVLIDLNLQEENYTTDINYFFFRNVLTLTKANISLQVQAVAYSEGGFGGYNPPPQIILKNIFVYAT